MGTLQICLILDKIAEEKETLQDQREQSCIANNCVLLNPGRVVIRKDDGNASIKVCDKRRKPREKSTRPLLPLRTARRSSTKTGVQASRSCSATAGRCRPMIGTRSCCSSCIMAITLSPVTARRKSENGRTPV